MSTILKAGTVPRVPVNPTSFHMRDLLADAEAVVEQARREAAATVTAARRAAREIRESARREGFEAGHGEGQASGREAGYQAALQESRERFSADQEQLTCALGELIDAVSSERTARLHEAEREVLDVALTIARRVTHGVGSLDSRVAQANLEAAMARVIERTDLVVHANPEDCATLATFAEASAAHLEDRPHIRLVPDQGIARGGVRLATALTEVDATLEGQLDMICSALTGNRA